MFKPTFAIAVNFVIKPDHVELFRKRVLQQAADSLSKEPGCYQFDVLVDVANPSHFFLYETYADAAAFQVHCETPHFSDFGKTVADWVESKTVNRLNILEPATS